MPDFYTATGTPVTGSAGTSSTMRSEFTAVATAFAKLAAYTGNANKAVVVNSAGTGYTVTTGTLALAGNLATTGAYNTTLAQAASTTVTLPGSSSTMARTDAAQTFTGVQTFSSQPIMSSLTASAAVATDGSKGLVSVTNTGTGSNVLATSPTISGLPVTTSWRAITRATADQAITSNVTRASATNMSFAIAESEEWIVDLNWLISNALATTGFITGVTVPASATIRLVVALTPTGSGDTHVSGNILARTTTSDNTDLNFTAATLANVDAANVHMWLWILNSTNAGTVQFQIAQSTSSGTALTLTKGSHMVANRVA